jgi:hypothetical protein
LLNPATGRPDRNRDYAMSTPQFPSPPGPDVPTQPHPLPRPSAPAQTPLVPPDLDQPRPGTPAENPALTHPVIPPSPPPAPTTPPAWD